MNPDEKKNKKSIPTQLGQKNIADCFHLCRWFIHLVFALIRPSFATFDFFFHFHFNNYQLASLFFSLIFFSWYLWTNNMFTKLTWALIMCLCVYANIENIIRWMMMMMMTTMVNKWNKNFFLLHIWSLVDIDFDLFAPSTNHSTKGSKINPL